jgi:hypothetical protein
MAKGKTVRGRTSRTRAFHSQSEDGARHAVGIGNLRVLITNRGEYWTAQGLEIDYFAVGKSLSDVQRRFETGLKATIAANLDEHGSIVPILRLAPAEVWQQFFVGVQAQLFAHSQMSFHVTNIREIEYWTPKAA